MNVVDSQAREALLYRRRALRRLFEENDAAEKSLHEEVERDWPDRALVEENATLLQRLTAAEERELAEIDAALSRLEGGTFGRCERCLGAIGRQRLRAMPEARYCITCSTADGNVS
ncbi:MAG: TraR/DksA family transcriptional regulator [Myxococcaceae bacterium]